jgi:hypothetical protein
MKLSLWALGLAASLILTGCGPTPYDHSHRDSFTRSVQNFIRFKLQPNQILVTDRYGTPLAGAQVLIGQSVDNPFVGNFVTTDINGILTIPAQWTKAQPVTIEAPGLVRTTFMDTLPTAQALELNEADGRSNLEVGGQTTD